MSSLISKKAFDRVWHAALWVTMRKYNISANLAHTIEQLYDKATSAAQMNGSIGEWFRTTVGVKQGCLLSPTLFNIFLKRISAEKTKLMTNSANCIQREIKVKGQKLGTVTSFKYLGAISDDGSKPEVLSRTAQATAALTKLKPIWRDNNISLGSKVKLM